MLWRAIAFQRRAPVHCNLLSFTVEMDMCSEKQQYYQLCILKCIFYVCCFFIKTVKTWPLLIPVPLHVHKFQYMRESLYSFMPYTCLAGLCLLFLNFKYFSVGVCLCISFIFSFPFYTLSRPRIPIMRRFWLPLSTTYTYIHSNVDHLFISLTLPKPILCVHYAFFSFFYSTLTNSRIVNLKLLLLVAINIHACSEYLCISMKTDKKKTVQQNKTHSNRFSCGAQLDVNSCTAFALEKKRISNFVKVLFFELEWFLKSIT